jgi:hypothetical protein
MGYLIQQYHEELLNALKPGQLKQKVVQNAVQKIYLM